MRSIVQKSDRGFNFCVIVPQAGLLALVAVAEHSGEFEKIIELSKR